MPSPNRDYKKILYKMKLIFYLITGILFLSFTACSPGSKVIYNKKVHDNERIKIRYQAYRSCKSFFISVYKRKEWINSFVIRDCSKRFIITRRNAADGNVNYAYNLVTDTLQNQFKCIDYNFLPQHCNATVARTFVPINEKERELFLRLQKIIQAGDYGVVISVNDVNKFLGWIKISY